MSSEKLMNVEARDLKDIAKLIDYEKFCNMGLFNKLLQQYKNKDFLSLTIKELQEVNDHCNDQVIRQYKINKERPWTKNIKNDQLYQVFQCFSEDQIFYFEEYEFAILEKRLDELIKEKNRDCNDDTISLKSYYSSGSQVSDDEGREDNKSNSSMLMYEYIE